MPPLDAVTLRSLLVCAATLGLAGCTRGCDFGPPARPCERTDECDAPDLCHRGHCSSPGYVEFDRRCRAEPACREQGKCGALRVRSFLGANHNLECAAVDETDCRAAEVCAENGLCSLYDGWCIADTTEDCAASRRCRTHEECSAERYECVRRWPESCPPLAAPADAPTWARPGPIAFDMQRMRGPWQPGAVESAILACQVQLDRRGASRVRIGRRCMDGPYFAPGGSVETFVRADMRLDPGDEIAVAVQTDWAIGRASKDSFVKASYIGSSPFQAGSGEERLICHVVAPELALPIGIEALAAVDKALAAAKLRRPGKYRLAPPHLDDIHRTLTEAAVWLGWHDLGLAARVQQMAAIEVAWARALAPMISARRKLASPPLTRVVIDGEVALQVHGHVCGAELDARRPADPRRPVDPDRCAIELRLENLGARPRSYGGRKSLNELGDMVWLRVADGRGEVVALDMIDIRTTLEAPPVPAAEIGPGNTGVLLISGIDQDLTRPGERADDVALLQGRVAFGGHFTLRAELVPDPPTAGTTAPKRRRPGR
jgi:hypothetical protein